MAHKFTAIHFGFRAEFRKNTQMLLLAVLIAAATVTTLGKGFVLAVPGATVIGVGPVEPPGMKEKNGIISAAGPVTNLLLCLAFLPLFLFTRDLVGNILYQIGYVGVWVNAMFAFFNMLPVPGFDGLKVLRWNPVIFGVLIITSLGLLVTF
jgi:Zn-dependent protease